MKNNRELIEKQKDAKYMEEIRHRYEVRNNTTRKLRKRQKSLENTSYLFNLISAATASFFIISFTSNYAIAWQIIFGAFLVALIVVGEIAKRYTIQEGAEGVNLYYLAVFGLACASFFVSYEGGNRFTVDMSEAPEKQHNARIDSLHAQIAAIDAKDAKMQSAWDEWTNTKKSWPSDAFTYFKDGGREKADEMKSIMLNQLLKLENRDIESNDIALANHQAETTKYGIIFGATAGAMDILLIICLIWAKMDEKSARLLLDPDEIRELSRARAHTRKDAHAHAHAHAHTQAHTHAHTHAMKVAHTTRKKEKDPECKKCSKKYNPNQKGASKKFCSEQCRNDYIRGEKKGVA